MVDTGFNSQKRRGIATIIGTFFFLVLMIGTFTALFGVFAYQADLISTQNSLAALDIKKANENFAIVSSCTYDAVDANWDLGVSVQNLATNHAEIVDLWVTSQVSSPYTPNQYTIDGKDAFIPPGGTGDILANYGGTKPTILNEKNTIKVVTVFGNIVSKEVTPPCLSEDALDTIQDELVAKPAVYASFPNPWVKGAADGLWAIIIVNPTNTDMIVYRTSLQVTSVANQDNFDTTGGACSKVTNISPSDNWCNQSDVIFWQANSGTTVPKYSAIDFSASTNAHSSLKNSPITTINTNAWTSFGQFGSLKSDTIATNETGIYAVPNIIMGTRIQDPASATLDAPIYSVLTAVSDASHDFWITITNTHSVGEIQDSSNLIINLPNGWTLTSSEADSHIGAPASSNPATTTTFDDDSTHISISLDATAGDDDILANKWATYHFKATAPTVADPTLYIFYTFAIGTVTDSDGDDPILMGPVTEFVVRVCPTSGCPA